MSTNKSINIIHLKLFYITEVAAMLRVGTPTIYKLIREGKLDAIKIGRAWKIPEDAINHYIQSLHNFSD